jgi:hypothetical protein
MTTSLDENFEKLTSRVALVSSLWVEVETVTIWVLAEVIGCEFHFASSILGSVVANKLRREIISNCARIAYSDEADVKAVETMLARHAKGARVRNMFDHSSITIHPEHPRALCLISQTPGWTQYEIITAADLKRFENQFTQLREDFGALRVRLEKASRAELLDSRHAQRLARLKEK